MLFPVLKATEEVLRAFETIMKNPVKIRALRTTNPALAGRLEDLCSLWGDLEPKDDQ